MSQFTERAERILAAAESAALRGEHCTELTMLIAQDEGIHMVTNSDWPLDSLTSHHGAKAAYRVSQRNNQVRVEGREGSRTFLLVSNARPAAGLLASIMPPASQGIQRSLTCQYPFPSRACYE